MTAFKHSDSISVADYLAGEAVSPTKHEYFGGTLHAMAGATIRHNVIGGSCFAFLHAKLRGKPCRSYNSNTKIRIEFPDHIRFHYPDAMVVCQGNPGTCHFQTQPVVVIEVLSDSTRRADLGEKRDAYLTIPSLKVLLFVEPDILSVTLHRRLPDGGFSTGRHEGLDAEIPSLEIETSLVLAEIYENVSF